MNQKCIVVIRKTDEKISGVLLGIFQHSRVIEPSIMLGGGNGGVEAYPVAVVNVDDVVYTFNLEKVSIKLVEEGYDFKHDIKDILDKANEREQQIASNMINKISSTMKETVKKEPIFICWHGNIRFEGSKENIDKIRCQIAELKAQGVVGPLTVPPGVQMTTYSDK